MYFHNWPQAQNPTAADLDAITLQNQQDSRFLRLPAELRNKIYSLVVESTTIYLQRRTPSSPLRLRRAATPLPQVCRQLHCEASPFLRQSPVFILQGHTHLEGFGQALADFRGPFQHVKKLEVPVEIAYGFAEYLGRVRVLGEQWSPTLELVARRFGAVDCVEVPEYLAREAEWWVYTVRKAFGKPELEVLFG